MVKTSSRNDCGGIGLESAVRSWPPTEPSVTWVPPNGGNYSSSSAIPAHAPYRRYRGYGLIFDELGDSRQVPAPRGRHKSQ